MKNIFKPKEKCKKKKASKTDWKIKKMESFYEIPWNYEFTTDLYESLENGSIPQNMEDKWFIYKEDNSVYFHRSWTGICVYELLLNTFTNRHIVRININPDEYKPEDTEKEVKKLENIIHNMKNQYNIFLIETLENLNNQINEPT